MRPSLLGTPLDDAETYSSTGFWILMDPVGPCRTAHLAEGAGFRTRDTVSRIHTFQACAFNHSATPPQGGSSYSLRAPARNSPVTSACMTGPASKGWDRKCSARKGPACEEPEPFPPVAAPGAAVARPIPRRDPESLSLPDREWAPRQPPACAHAPIQAISRGAILENGAARCRALFPSAKVNARAPAFWRSAEPKPQ